MSNRLLEKGREGFLDGTIDFDTNTIKAILLDLNTADAAVKAITGATNATPIVVTATGHGFTTGDVVVIGGVGGNLAANNVWKIVTVDANSFSLRDVKDGSTNSVGSAAYTSGGYVVCLGPSAAGDNLDDFDACRVGTDQTLTSPTVTNGIADAADSTWTAVTGATVEAIGLYKDTGTASTSRMAFFADGRVVVEIAAATTMGAGATTFPVLPLPAGLANGTVLTFSNGKTITLTAAPAAGARTITGTGTNTDVFAAGAYASADTSPASGLPVTPNGGNITAQYPASGPWGSAPGIFQL
jgi:hypothetical protein